MLQRLIIGTRYDLGYTFYLPIARMDQPHEILHGPCADVAGAGMKVFRKSMTKILKMSLYPPQGAAGHASNIPLPFLFHEGKLTLCNHFNRIYEKQYNFLI